MITPHWDITSLIMYVVLGGHSVFCIYSVQKKIVINNRRIFTNMYYISLIFIWDIIASFRYVDVNIGGNDTLGYIQYFEECLIATKGIPFVLEEHFEPLFKVICKSIRLFTADYHVFFLILYGFIIYSFLLFIEEFVTKQTSKIPFVLLIFEFWRGFNTFRTTLALSFILLGLVMFHKGKEKRGLLIAAMSIFIHSASIIYFMIIPFLHICKRRKFKIWQGMVFALGIYVCTRGMQRFLLTTGSPVLELFDTGAMRGYLSHSLKKSIFSFNMITLEHTALFITMMLFNKEIKASMENKSIEEKKKIKMLWTICFFDFLTVPLTFVLGVWRGYEYFYIPRLIMWGEIIELLRRKFTINSRWIVTSIFLIIFVGWLVFRMYSMWEDSGLMPYAFAPFQYVIK